MANIATLTDDELSGIGLGPEHGVAKTRINELITKVNGMDAPSEFPYTPSTPANWTSAPTTLQSGLDNAASDIKLDKTHRTGSGADHSAVAAATAAIALISDDHVRAVCALLPAQTDEAEVSAALTGSAAKLFVPSEVVIVVTGASGVIAGDATINVGTATGGAQILSAQALTGLNAVGKCRRIPLAEAAIAVAGNATLFANVEAADGSATTLVLSVFVLGRQF